MSCIHKYYSFQVVKNLVPHPCVHLSIFSTFPHIAQQNRYTRFSVIS